MDDLQTISTLLSNGVFPIAMCAILCIFIKYIMDEFEVTLNKLEDAIQTLSTRVDTILELQKKKENLE